MIQDKCLHRQIQTYVPKLSIAMTEKKEKT